MMRFNICLLTGLLLISFNLCAMDPLMESEIEKHNKGLSRSWALWRKAPAPIPLHIPAHYRFAEFDSVTQIYKDKNPLWINVHENHYDDEAYYYFYLYKNGPAHLKYMSDFVPGNLGYIGDARVICKSHDCHLESLYIAPELRRQGYGSYLLRLIGSTIFKDSRYNSLKGYATPMHLKKNEAMEQMHPKLHEFYKRHGAYQPGSDKNSFMYSINKSIFE